MKSISTPPPHPHPGWDASPSQGYPQLYVCQYPLHEGGERYCESQVSCPRTQHNVLGQGSNPNTFFRRGVANHKTTAPPHFEEKVNIEIINHP